MKISNKAALVTLWFNRGILGAMALLMLAVPALIRWYSTVRPLIFEAGVALTVAFYACTPLAALALLRLDRLLRNILRGQVFVHDNVGIIRTIRWCCLGVSLVCLPAMLFYPPLVFLAVIMGFLSLVVNVLCQVMKAAVAIREENDLTV